MKAQSIYRTICENITPEGRLPQGFLIADKDAQPGKICFAPGAKDGIGLFHKEHHLDRVSVKIVQYMKTGSYAYIAGLLRMYRTLQVIDPVIKHIQSNHEAFDARQVIDFAFELVFESMEIEPVKFGIALLGMFDFSGEPQIVNAVMALALYDEFTLFSLVALKNWEDGNVHQFFIAQRVQGWGKVHAVELLKADTEEIRDWILRYGCKNHVMDAYLGLTCAIKGNLIEALRMDVMDSGLFDGICVIIDALLVEGPVAGINDYEHAEDALRLYLQSATKHAATLKHLWHVLNVRDWLTNAQNGYKEELLVLCACIAGMPRWHGLIKDAVAQGEEEMLFCAVDSAKRLQMDISALLIKTVMKKPVECSAYISMLYGRAEYAKRLTATYEKTLPLTEMATGMGDDHFAAELQREHQCLEHVLAELGPYPNMGAKLLEAALQSPVVRERSMALSVLEKWSEDLWVSVWHISPSVGGVLKRIALEEVDEELRMRMVKLLSK